MIIKNFLTREECQILLEEAEVSNSWRPQHADTGIYILPSKNHKIMIDINKRVSELFDKYLMVGPIWFTPLGSNRTWSTSIVS